MTRWLRTRAASPSLGSPPASAGGSGQHRVVPWTRLVAVHAPLPQTEPARFWFRARPRCIAGVERELAVASRTEPQPANRLDPGTEETLRAQTSPAADPFVGRVLSHYRLEQRLGAGGMGVLYRATDLKLGRAVAVKLLARHLVTDETAKARFVREARAASALDHPNIANVHDIGEEDGELFIVMALYEGETLRQRLEKGRLPVDEAVGILRQVALGLEAAHRAGIVHRDIKPANILMTTGGTAK